MIISFIFAFFSITAFFYYLFSMYAAREFFSNPTAINCDFHPPVTILKPLCGLEWESYDNLISFCEQDYPCYELIFCLQNPEDPSLELVKKIIATYPDKSINLIIDSTSIGSNLKVSNLANGYKIAAYNIIILSDSDIRVKSDYLKTLIQPFQSQKVGVVTCLYKSLTKGWLASFEALEIATQFVPRVLTAKKLEPISFACGATIAIRREVLEEIGGFGAIADHLADDYQLGYLPHQAGYEVVLSDYLVEHSLAQVTLTEFLQRQIRWAKCIRVERFGGYLGLIFTQGIPMSLFYLIASGGSFFGWLIFLVTWATRLFLAAFVGIKLMSDPVTRKYFFWLPLRDIVSFGIWVYSFWGDRITWRGKTFILQKGGKMQYDCQA